MKYILVTFFLIVLIVNIKAKDFVTYISSDYEIYAPDKQSVVLARNEVEYAQSRFRTLIGEKPPKIFVILFTSNEDMTDFDSWKIKPDGIGVLKWLTQPTMEKLIENSLEKCKEEFIDINQDRLKMPSIASSTLSHEAGHIFLINYVDNNVITSDSLYNHITKQKITFYGHPLIPDWLDEAFAVYCEQQNVIRWRILWLKKRIRNLYALSEFLTNERPIFSDSQHKSCSGITTNSWNEKTDIYYAQTVAFLNYLIDKEGREFAKILIKELADGKDFNTILQTVKTLPHGNIELENDFKNWIVRYK